MEAVQAIEAARRVKERLETTLVQQVQAAFDAMYAETGVCLQGVEVSLVDASNMVDEQRRVVVAAVTLRGHAL